MRAAVICISNCTCSSPQAQRTRNHTQICFNSRCDNVIGIGKWLATTTRNEIAGHTSAQTSIRFVSSLTLHPRLHAHHLVADALAASTHQRMCKADEQCAFRRCAPPLLCPVVWRKRDTSPRTRRALAVHTPTRTCCLMRDTMCADCKWRAR